MIGASLEAITMAEDRQKFRAAMEEIGLQQARSRVVRGVEEALDFQPQVG